LEDPRLGEHLLRLGEPGQLVAAFLVLEVATVVREIHREVARLDPQQPIVDQPVVALE